MPPGESAWQAQSGQQPLAPARKSRKKLLIIGLGILAAIIVGIVVVAIVAHPGKYSDHGVTFKYPASWKHGQASFAAQSGSAIWSETFAPVSGVEGVTVSQYGLNADVSSAAPADVLAEVTNLASTLAQKLGGSVTSDVKPVQVGALQGYQVTMTATIEDTALTIDLTMLFHGKDQYNIACQAGASKQNEINSGCQQIKDTFALTG